ncbi:MAG: poly-gamma-glutamate hydrolase family protein, partial [Actinomycetota bacterium]|nr:poly-gamma-glutamate hydrolase family protein [Actinomycetota bacterium]
MLDELLACPGVEERTDLRSPVGFLALHGGLEAGTAEIAAAAAAAADASLYAVVQPDDLHWHIPSHRYDPEH